MVDEEEPLLSYISIRMAAQDRERSLICGRPVRQKEGQAEFINATARGLTALGRRPSSICLRPSRQAEAQPSTSMGCMMTASLRANATLAFFSQAIEDLTDRSRS